MKGLVALAAGVAAGVVVEQLAVRQPWRADPYAEEEFGSVRGEPHWLRADDGTELYVEVHPCADPQAPTLVIAHGFCLNQDSWHFQRKDLRGRARMVLWDQRGHGRSERGPLENTTVEQLGRDLKTVVDTFADGPVTLVGHSMGGMTVMSLAAQFPEMFVDRVRAVGLVATSAGHLTTDFLGLHPVLAKRASTLASGVRPNRVLMGSVAQKVRTTDLNFMVTKRGSFGPGAPNSLNRFMMQMLNGTSMETVVDFLPTLLAHDLRDSLKAMTDVPVSIVCGTHDVLTPQSHTRTLMELLPNAHGEILPGVGHMVQLERPREVTEGIERLAFSHSSP
jgi:pimeloyl-ACP methyl ester carboxylesterase